MRCADCKFWVVIDGDRAAGECHRVAPCASAGLADLPIECRIAIWPVTSAAAFCGDFAAKAVKHVSFV